MFSIPFPSGSCFCDLFLRGSLGLRIDFALFRLVLSVGGDFDPIRSEGEIVFLLLNSRSL